MYTEDIKRDHNILRAMMKVRDPKEENEQDELRDAVHKTLKSHMLSYLRDDNSLKIIRKDLKGNEDKIPTIKNVGTKTSHGLLDMTYGDEPLT